MNERSVQPDPDPADLILSNMYSLVLGFCFFGIKRNDDCKQKN